MRVLALDTTTRAGSVAIVHDDAVEYIARTRGRADVIVLDGCDSHGIALAFRKRSFYEGLHAHFGREGVLVMNLVGATDERRANLRLLAATFPGTIIVQDVADGNQVAFAFKDAAFAPRWSQIEARAAGLARRHSIDLWMIARELRESHEHRSATPW